MSKRVNETLAIFYTLSFLSMFGMGFVGATYATFLTSYGLDRLAMNTVNIFFMIALFMGEVPTGAIADVFGRKNACILAFAIRATGMVIYGFSHSFWAFVFAEVISGIGLTFENGALQAWAVDRLKHWDGEHAIERIYRRKAQWKLLGAISGSIIGAAISTYGLALPWFFGAGVLYFVSIFIAVGMQEEYFKKKSYSFTGKCIAFKQAISDGVRFGMKSSVIQFLFIANAVFMFAVQAPNMFWQLYFRPHVPSQVHLGIIHAVALAAMFAGATYSMKIAAKIGCERRTILLSFVITGIWLGISGLFPIFAVALPAFILHEFSRGIFDPVKDNYLNKHIPSESRATLDSLQSTTRHIGAVAGLLISGLLAASTSDGTSWVVSGAVLACGAIALAMRMKSNTTSEAF